MSLLIYGMISSLDGYVADEAGRFDWAEPDEQVHVFINNLQRDAGTHLYGRRMYETMVAWESPELSANQPPYIQDFARIWRAADKVVYSTTLREVHSARTRLERRFDPDAVRRLKQDAERNVLIAGPTLASHAIRAGLVDECHLFIAPVVVGGGLPAFPGVQAPLRLLDERRFERGMVYLRYGTG